MPRAQNAQRQEQRVYAPPPHVSRRPRGEDDGGGRRQTLVFAVLIAALGFLGIVVWNAYSAAPTDDKAPLILADGAFKTPHQGGEDEPLPTEALDKALVGSPTPMEAVQVRPPAEEPLQTTPAAATVSAPAAKAPAIRFSSDGPFLAQIAALRSEAAAAEAWSRFADAAPSTFQGARRDVQRADLGAKGVYFRVRAGYFADRDNAARFCDRIKALKQECIVVGR